MKKLLLVLALAPGLACGWTVETRTDPMDDSVMVAARHGWVDLIRAPASPYKSMRAELAFFCSRERESVALIFSMPVNASDERLLGGRSEVYGRIRWGDDVPNDFTGELTSGSNTIRFSSAVASRMEQYDSVMFEVPWHGGPAAIARFDLVGAVVAIQQARQLCEVAD